jgi:hypothetical protein
LSTEDPVPGGEEPVFGRTEDGGLCDNLVRTFPQDQMLDTFARPIVPSHYDFPVHAV